MIRIGPAGIPLSCKGRTVKDGIIYTRNLELDAMQVQFVRGIRMGKEEAMEVGRVAQEALVELHVHAPYYTNLAGDERNVERAVEKIVSAGMLADAMGAKTLAIHCGLYHPDGAQRTTDLVVQNLSKIMDSFRAEGVRVLPALEVAGKQALFGSLDEVVEVCRRVPGVIPILDFAHIHCRGNGSLLTEQDFRDVFDKAKSLGLDWFLIHFTGILYENGNERYHLPIKKGDLRFEPLVESILDDDHDVTIISHSPILEHDAMYMKIVLDRVREKRDLRQARIEAQKAADEDRERQRLDRERQAEEKRKAKEAAAAKVAKPKAAKAAKAPPKKGPAKKAPARKAQARKTSAKRARPRPATVKGTPARKAPRKKTKAAVAPRRAKTAKKSAVKPRPRKTARKEAAKPARRPRKAAKRRR